MSREPAEQGSSPGTDSVSQPGARLRSLEERRRLVAESLQVGNPVNRARDLPEQADPRHDCQIELRVEDIRAYEHNPRRAGNAKFAEIKESIRETGIRTPLTVTRRPGENHFIVEAGGNTRLLAIQQLWAESRDSRFEKLTVVFRPWRSESHVLTSHLVENELRGEMTFWDKANGVLTLKARLEAEKGCALSLQRLEKEMKALGLTVNAATLTHYQFATERLRTLGEAVDDLSALAVKTMQPRLNLMKRYAQARAALAEADLYATVFEPVFRRAVDRYRQSQVFSASDLCRACEEVLARHLGEPVPQLRSALASLQRAPQSTSGTPTAQASAQAIPSGAMAPTTVVDPSHSVTGLSTAKAATGDSHGPVRTGDLSPSKDENPTLLSRVIEEVRHLAALVGIEALVRLDPGAPLGYYMDCLPISTGIDSSPQYRQQSWWLLAALSGRLDKPTSASDLEVSTDGDSGKDDASGQDRGALASPTVFDPAFVGSLVDPTHETGTAFWNILTIVRALRSSSTAQHAITEAPRGSL